ncbi:Gfo/Idh/MocA family protein [Paenibacillus sp. MBLB4367]|uniref:Gfo/Idh/MocA family protein n=1 Tax=Paenibacillus sp. MBLB4367 TaxID=3384767 RepID=UPI0039082004
MRKVKIGMISFAHSHAYGYLEGLLRLPQVEVAGIADEVHDRVKEVTETNGIPYFANYEELLAKDIDAVVICSENVHHAKLTIASAKAKKHVLCEKPLGISVAEMKEMIDVCAENGVQLMTAFPCRYLSGVIAAKAAIDRGEIGDIIAIKGTNRGSMPGGWFIDKSLSGGGAVFDHTVHVMDLIHWITGSTVTEVYAESGTLFNDIPIDDAGMVHAKFANGVITVLDPSWSRSAPFPTWGDVTMEIVGTKGVISVDSFGQKNDVYSKKNGRASWSPWTDNMDFLLIEDFAEAIRTGSPVPITGQDGMNAAGVALAAYDSIQAGKAVSIG